MDWRQRIVELVFVKQRIQELDRDSLWEHRLPRIAATEEQILECESHIGERLPDSYRSFLKFAGGWPAFYQAVDLFGPDDLYGGPRYLRAEKMLEDIAQDALTASGVSRRDLIPIAATPVDLDIFVLTRRATETPGVVLWFASREIDRFSDFTQFFTAMIDCNREEIVDLQNE